MNFLRNSRHKRRQSQGDGRGDLVTCTKSGMPLLAPCFKFMICIYLIAFVFNLPDNWKSTFGFALS